MMKYRTKHTIVEATQWFINGDHPKVKPYGNLPMGKPMCSQCGKKRTTHGWLQSNPGKRVCPGDWIIISLDFEPSSCKQDVFESNFQMIEEKKVSTPTEPANAGYASTLDTICDFCEDNATNFCKKPCSDCSVLFALSKELRFRPRQSIVNAVNTHSALEAERDELKTENERLLCFVETIQNNSGSGKGVLLSDIARLNEIIKTQEANQNLLMNTLQSLNAALWGVEIPKKGSKNNVQTQLTSSGLVLRQMEESRSVLASKKTLKEKRAAAKDVFQSCIARLDKVTEDRSMWSEMLKVEKQLDAMAVKCDRLEALLAPQKTKKEKKSAQ